MKYPYNTQYFPPLPVLELSLCAPDSSEIIGPFEGIVDTGADGTLIPENLLSQLAATQVDEAWMRSQWGEGRLVHLFMVDIKLGETMFPGIDVVGDERGKEIILGRNFINRLRLFLDGPANLLQIIEQ